MSVRGIPDFIGHYRGKFFAVEAKAPGKKPTGFQALQIAAIKASGGAVFVVSDRESLGVLQDWLLERC
jgi:penicillin-binding protein-related factor A (putative recombinase)